MTKKLMILLGALLMLATVPAQAAEREEYTLKQLKEKVQKMEVLQWNRMPTLFIYVERLDWYDNQEDINVFYTAQKVWKQNPNNFAAVFNYGLIIMSNDYGEGLSLNDIQIDEAYRVLEQAKKLRPNHKETYDLQVYLLDLKLFGPTWLGPGMTDEEMISIYRAHPDLARKQLSLLQTMFKNWPEQVLAWNYDQAAIICRALNRDEDASAYQIQADFLYKQLEEEEAAKWRAQQEAQKGLASSIKQAFSFWRSK